jgi:hypothetical protein
MNTLNALRDQRGDDVVLPFARAHTCDNTTGATEQNAFVNLQEQRREEPKEMRVSYIKPSSSDTPL